MPPRASVLWAAPVLSLDTDSPQQGGGAATAGVPRHYGPFPPRRAVIDLDAGISADGDQASSSSSSGRRGGQARRAAYAQSAIAVRFSSTVTASGVAPETIRHRSEAVMDTEMRQLIGSQRRSRSSSGSGPPR